MTSDQGLSIFDDNEPGEDVTQDVTEGAADDATQVMPAVPPKPAKAAPSAEKKSGLLDDKLIAEIGVAARSEKKSAGTGGQ